MSTIGERAKVAWTKRLLDEEKKLEILRETARNDIKNISDQIRNVLEDQKEVIDRQLSSGEQSSCQFQLLTADKMILLRSSLDTLELEKPDDVWWDSHPLNPVVRDFERWCNGEMLNAQVILSDNILVIVKPYTA